MHYKFKIKLSNIINLYKYKVMNSNSKYFYSPHGMTWNMNICYYKTNKTNKRPCEQILTSYIIMSYVRR